ncbi:MAG: PTS sugar transporter subunit IIA [Pseudomonadota bacterium]
MVLTDLTPAEAVIANLRVSSKKSLLQELAQRMAPLVNGDPRDIFAALLERERLGSTGMGRGVAIPHCRLPQVTSILGGLARLETPIDFEAVDREPVDLVYVLVAPEGAGSDHLKALARISRVLRDQAICQALRGARDEAALYAILSDQERDASRAA